MLSAGKQHLVTGLKLSGTDLRKAELDFYMGRYISVGGISAIMTGLSYIGVTKISIPAVLQPPVIAWQTFMFYTCSCIAMAISLYNLALSAFLVVNAQGLMLRGPPNSVVKCIEILSAQWRLVRVLVTLAVILTLMSANAIMWMKLDPTTSKPGAAIAVSVIVRASHPPNAAHPGDRTDRPHTRRSSSSSSPRWSG